MGEIQFEGKSHVEQTSGVWVDGEYVGYLKEGEPFLDRVAEQHLGKSTSQLRKGSSGR
jgi:hypothetical protein